MPAAAPVIALCADVDPRARTVPADAFLARLPRLLAGVARDGVVRPFAVVDSGAVEGALARDADPFRVIVAASLEPGGLPLRWAVVAGEDDAAPARARAELARRREGLAVVSGHAPTDSLLEDLAPLLDALVAEMTAHQREVARRLLVEGRRQAAVAAELGVSRATISVAVARGRVRDLERATRGLNGLLQAGIAARERAESGQAPAAPGPVGRPIAAAAG